MLHLRLVQHLQHISEPMYISHLIFQHIQIYLENEDNSCIQVKKKVLLWCCLVFLSWDV